MTTRRKFLTSLGLGMTPALLPGLDRLSSGTPFSDPLPEYHYPKPASLDEAANMDGQLMVRLAYFDPELREKLPAFAVKVRKGQLRRSRSWHFEQDDVVVLWLDEFGQNSSLELSSGRERLVFDLQDVFEQLELEGRLGTLQVRASILLDHEIGTIDPADLGIHDPGKDFRFIIMADPQGGDTSDPADNRCRMKVHNAFVEESVRLAGELETGEPETAPLFCLMLGDIVDGQGEARDFASMKAFFDRLKMPVLYEMGNHESRYDTRFGPGYDMSGFQNYFAAQKAVNGLEKLLYSFNLGDWHLIIWPDPLRKDFWETHPHYFDWLERDLEAHRDRPTLFFQHVSMQPMGIDPLVSYAESAYVKRLLFSLLSKHGNVRNIYSGHVHIPVKASFKTAVEIAGINCINIPAAGYRPRAFGEEDFHGGPAQGICIVDIKSKQCRTTYRTVTREKFTYPDRLPVFDSDRYPLWLNDKWELPTSGDFVNGDLSAQLKGWHRRYVYMEDKDPSNSCEVRELEDGSPALYLKSTKRGFAAPGQDRLPQGLNRVCQALELRPGREPSIRFEYLLDPDSCDPEGLNGLYIRTELYRGRICLQDHFHCANRAWVNVGGSYRRKARVEPRFFALNDKPGQWMQVRIMPDLELLGCGPNRELPEAGPDRLVFTAGIWNVNVGAYRPFAAYLRNFALDYDHKGVSNIDGEAISELPLEKKWWRGKLMPSGNVAGEHHYHFEDWDELNY